MIYNMLLTLSKRLGAYFYAKNYSPTLAECAEILEKLKKYL